MKLGISWIIGSCFELEFCYPNIPVVPVSNQTFVAVHTKYWKINLVANLCVSTSRVKCNTHYIYTLHLFLSHFTLLLKKE